MTKKQLESALETETDALGAFQQEFEVLKQDKKWKEADKHKHKIQVIQGIIEKIKLAITQKNAYRREQDFDAMNGEKMDKIQVSLEKEILEATESYKDQLTKFLADQDQEMLDFLNKTDEDLAKEE